MRIENLAENKGSVTTSSPFKTPKPPGRGQNLALTRLEVVTVLATLGLLAIILAPALASTKSDSDRAICTNNLRLIGRAVQTWAADHSQQPPWWVRTTDGGTWTSPKPGVAWVEFAVLSNEIATPKILACPADQATRSAATWDLYWSAAFHGLASYDLWIHADGNTPRAVLCTDRNARFDAASAGSCDSGIIGFLTLDHRSTSLLAWTNEIHGIAGHVLLMDGSTEFTSTARLRELALAPEADPRDSGHVIWARR